MKTLKELATFQTKSYKSYIIKFNDLQNLYYVSKDNHHIYSNASLSDVKFNIDLITN